MSAPSTAQLNYEKSGQQFATVSIPDLRNQQLQMLREDARVGLPPLATTAMDELANIKEAISQSRTTEESEQESTTPKDWLSTIATADQSDIEPLIDSILEYYPAGGTPIIALTATEENPQLAATVGRTVLSLASRTNGRFLLIDSDLQNGGLTYNMDRVGRPGLVELVNKKDEWQDAVFATGNPDIDFLPIGRSTFGNMEDISKWIGRTLPQFQQEYQYVIVSAGDAHEEQSQIWCGQASGSYLLVSLTSSNQFVAKSAVTHLKSHGARILGCVITDSK